MPDINQVKVKLPFLCLIVGQKCNLKCKHCANFTPLMRQSYFELDNLKRDLLAVSKVAFIDSFQIQGGEPVDSPFLAELLDYIVDLKFVGHIQIATNAVKPLSDAQIISIKRANATIRISNYNVVSKSAARMVAQCEEHQIHHAVYQFAYGNGEWLDLGGIDTEEVSEDEGKSNFESCPFNKCLTLEDGLMARCSRGTTAHIAQQFEPRPGDHLYIRGIENRNELLIKLIEYTQTPKAMRACALCRGGKTGFVEAGAQFTREEVSALLARGHNWRPIA